MKAPSKPKEAVYCDRCEHFAPDDNTLCAKGHKPRLYGAGTWFGAYKRRCEDFEDDKGPVSKITTPCREIQELGKEEQ